MSHDSTIITSTPTVKQTPSIVTISAAAVDSQRRSKAAARTRRNENRARLAATIITPRSLRPNDWLQRECAEGDADAIAIRDGWQFAMPKNPNKCPAPTSRTIGTTNPFHDAELEARVADARRFASVMVRRSEAQIIRRATQEDDCAQEFAMKILRSLLDGTYEETGRFRQWLGEMWKWHLHSAIETLSDERNNVSGIFSKDTWDDDAGEFMDKGSAMYGRVREIVVSEHRQAVTQAEERTMEHYRSRVSKLSAENQDLCRLLVLLGDVTHKELAEELGVSTKTVQRRFKALRAEVQRLQQRDEANVCIRGCADSPGDHRRPVSKTVLMPIGLERRYFTAEQTAEYLGGLNARTVARWAREGYIPAIPIGEGKRRLWRFVQADLDTWMSDRRCGGKLAA